MLVCSFPRAPVPSKANALCVGTRIARPVTGCSTITHHSLPSLSALVALDTLSVSALEEQPASQHGGDTC